MLSGCSPADLWKGNREYSREQFSSALKKYGEASAKNPNDPKPVFNAGDALYRMKQLDEAAEAFSQLTDPAKTKDLAPKAYYNLGNTRFNQERYKESVEAYKQCLLLDPNEEDCRFNLVKTLQRMKNPPPPQKNKPKNDKDKPEDKSKEQNPSSPRPQSMSQEDAERILQAVKEREKAPTRSNASKKGQPGPGGALDW